MPLPPWLPQLIVFDGENWDLFEDSIYKEFKRQFITSHPTIFSKPVFYKKEPTEKGKVATFWHLTTEGEVESERVPDLERCERICWIRPVIENVNDPSIKHWYTERRSKNGKIQRRLCILVDCVEDCILIVLTETPRFFVLLTFYQIKEKYRKDKLIREFEAYKKTNTAL